MKKTRFTEEQMVTTDRAGRGRRAADADVGLIRRAARTLLGAVLAGTFLWSESAWAASLDPELQMVVERLAKQFSDGIATFDGGQAASGQTGTAFEGQTVVLFGLTSCGGGNGSRQFLAVFEHHVDRLQLSNGQRLRPYQLVAVVAVGDDSDRWFKSIDFKGDRIVLAGGRWLKADAHCCPSATARAIYRLGQRGLAEVRR